MLPKTQLTLEEVQQQFEQWRRHRKKRDRIPSALWEAAASLSEQHSAHQISKLLHVNHTDVRDHIREYRESNRIQRPHEGSFVELGLLSPASLSECIIEMEKPGGARMKISIKGTCPDIAGVSRAFLG
jgi:hypothetical protein